MGWVNISLLIRHIILLLLFALIPHMVDASTEKPAPKNDCLKCHNELWQEKMAKRYIHAPFLEKKCTKCHAKDYLSNPKYPLISSSGDGSKKWTRKSLRPATNHWFEFKADENSVIMILEASYGSVIRLYREILLPPLDDLTDAADIYGRNPPKISSVKVQEVKKGIFLSASISWQTDRPTDSMITYGIKDLQQTTPLNGRLRTEHLETLNILKPGQTYQFKITAKDAVGNRIKSDIFKFSTVTTFSKSVKKSAAESCCLAAPLGLESNFFRKGDRYLVNITFIRPVKLFFALQTKSPLSKPPNEPETLDDQPQVARHIITNEEEITTFIVCKTCHRDFSSHHPVNVYPKKGMKIPADYPTMAGGKISCVSCHAPHASDLKHRMIKDYRQELCIGCHNSFNPTNRQTRYR